LIFKPFEGSPRFLWITLFISCREPRQSLENQGFGWNAQKKSKVSIPYKSTTYARYGVCSGLCDIFILLLCRTTIFVHK
jgi:hypothetical protein